MTTRRLFIAVLLAIAAASPNGRTQDAPSPTPAPAEGANAPETQRPVFRGGATFVRVDAYPRRNGQVVPGLTADDFEVTEDGKPQSVETFDFIQFSPNTPDNERRDPNTFADSERQAADPRNRVFVVYFDLFHLSFTAVNDVRTPVLNFLNRAIGPTDLFATMTPETLVSGMVFGRRSEQIAADMGRLWLEVETGPHVVPRNEIEQLVWSCGGDGLVRLHRDDLLFTSLENLVIRLGALKDERKNILFISEGFRPRPMRGGGGGSGRVPQIGVGPSGRLGLGNQQPYGRNDAVCDRYLGRLPNLDFEQRFRDLLREAVRANVSVYPIDVGGLKVNMAIADASLRTSDLSRAIAQQGERAAGMETLRTLAENTDGFAVVNTNDVSAGVQRIADSLSSHYVLGYYSSNPATDGKFREIRVRVKRPGVSVAARRGYYALTSVLAEAAASSPPPATPTPVDEALAHLARVRDDAEVYGHGAVREGRLDLVVELSARQIGQGRWKQGADVRLNVTGPAATPRTASGRIDAGRRATLVSVPIDPDLPGPYRVAVRLSGPDGIIEDRFDVPAPEIAEGGPLAFRGLPSPRVPVRPAADFQFRRNERLRIEWPIGRDDAAATPGARVLDRNGKPLTVALTVADRIEEAGTIAAVDVLMSAFSEGDYVVELTRGDRAERARRLFAFRVVR